MEKLYDISEVCRLIGTTSRTLRFYEEEGILESTAIPFSNRRRYTEKQLLRIKRVTALRALGLSVKKIGELLQNKLSLEEAIWERRAEMLCLMMEKQRQINLLDEVLRDIQSGGAEASAAVPAPECTDKQIELVKELTDSLLASEFSALTARFSEEMQAVLPAEILVHKWNMMQKGLGAFLSKDTPYRDEKMGNIVLCPLRYEHMILRVKYVFHGETVCGLWMDYVQKKNGGFV